MISLPQPSRQAVLIGAAVVVFLILGGGALWYWQAAHERQATAAYAAALTRVGAVRGPQATPAARAAATRGLEAALQAYPSAPIAAQAAYELATLRYAERQYPASRSAYEIALAKGAGGTLRTLARIGIGYTWEAERNFSKAVEAFQAAALGLRPGDPLYEEALEDLGRAQELAGRKDDAIQTYRRILKDLPKSPRGDEIRARLASLGATP